jgi:hypothetical protein
VVKARDEPLADDAMQAMVAAQGLRCPPGQTHRLEARFDRIARKLAVTMHAIWRDGTEFVWTQAEAARA